MLWLQIQFFSIFHSPVTVEYPRDSDIRTLPIMECLQKLARDEFPRRTSSQFDDRSPDQRVVFIEAVLQNTVATITDRRIIKTKDIPTEMAPSNNSNIPPGLRLVEVRCEYPFPFYMAQEKFLELFNSINIDPYVLHLIRLNSFGFYQFPKPPASKNDSEISSYYLSTLYYALAWSFDPKTREARAILMSRGVEPSRKLTRPTVQFSDFVRLLRGFLPVFEVCRCPSAFLSLAVATQLVHWLDGYILSQLEEIRDAETATGHGDIVSTGKMLNAKEITRCSRAMAQSLTVLANIQRHLEVAKAALVHASKTSPSQQGVRDALSVLETQLLWNESTSEYLLQRARNQITVVSNAFSLSYSNAKTNSFKVYSRMRMLRKANGLLFKVDVWLSKVTN